MPPIYIITSDISTLVLVISKKHRRDYDSKHCDVKDFIKSRDVVELGWLVGEPDYFSSRTNGLPEICVPER